MQTLVAAANPAWSAPQRTLYEALLAQIAAPPHPQRATTISVAYPERIAKHADAPVRAIAAFIVALTRCTGPDAPASVGFLFATRAALSNIVAQVSGEKWRQRGGALATRQFSDDGESYVMFEGSSAQTRVVCACLEEPRWAGAFYELKTVIVCAPIALDAFCVRADAAAWRARNPDAALAVIAGRTAPPEAAPATSWFGRLFGR